MGGGTKFLKNHQGERGGERENANYIYIYIHISIYIHIYRERYYACV